jgi:hypothetical protein
LKEILVEKIVKIVEQIVTRAKAKDGAVSRAELAGVMPVNRPPLGASGAAPTAAGMMTMVGESVPVTDHR